MIGHLIRRLHQRSTHLFMQRMQQAGFDLTPVQFAAMDAISNDPGIDQARVAEAIAYDRATIGGVIERLVQKGLVARMVSKRDRRAREVSLTAEGADLLERIRPEVRALQSAILDGLDQSEQTAFTSLAIKAVQSSLGADDA